MPPQQNFPAGTGRKESALQGKTSLEEEFCWEYSALVTRTDQHLKPWGFLRTGVNGSPGTNSQLCREMSQVPLCCIMNNINPLAFISIQSIPHCCESTWREKEKAESSPREQTMPGPSASLGGTHTPLLLLPETVYLYWDIFLLKASSGHHLPTAGAWGWERGRGAQDGLSPGLKGWRFLSEASWECEASPESSSCSVASAPQHCTVMALCSPP